jgi:hypothetical protein
VRPKTLLVLTLLVGVLGAFILLFERDLPSTDERRDLENRVLPVEVDNVQEVVIERDGETARLELSDELGDWRLTEPRHARADNGDVRSLLNELATLEKGRTLSEIVSSEVGLERPRLRLTIIEDDDEWRLAVGSDIPATSDVVVSVEGRGTFVTSNRFLDQIARSPGDWRDRKVFPATETEIEEIRASMVTGELVLAKRDDHFVLEKPFRDDADRGRVSELLTALEGLTVEEFLDDELSALALGLEPPAYEIAVALEDRDSPFVVRLGAETDNGEQRFAEAEGQVFRLETDLPAILDQESRLWQSLDWTDLEAYEVDSVLLTRNEMETELVRVDGEWQRDGQDVPYSVASEFLSSIVGVRGERVIERGAETGGNGARQSVSLLLRTADRVEVLTLRSAAEDASYADREGRLYLLEVDSETADAVLVAVDTVLNAATAASEDVASASDG